MIFRSTIGPSRHQGRSYVIVLLSLSSSQNLKTKGLQCHKASSSSVRHPIERIHTQLLSLLCPTALPSWQTAVNPQLYFSIASSISMVHFTVQLLCQRSLPASTAAPFSPPSHHTLCLPWFNHRVPIIHQIWPEYKALSSLVLTIYIYTASRGSRQTQTPGIHNQTHAHTVH